MSSKSSPLARSTASQRAEWVSELVAHRDTYGVVSHLSQTIGVLRQTLYKIFIFTKRACLVPLPTVELL